MQIFGIVAQQLLILYVFMVIGYVLNKKHVVHDKIGDVLSQLIVNIFMPALVFENMSGNMRVSALQREWPLILTGALVLAATYWLSLFATRKMRENRMLYVYSYTISNYGYIGYSVISAVFGAEMLYRTILFCMPMTVFIYTTGKDMFAPTKTKFKDLIKNPIIIAMVLGGIIGLLEIDLPGAVAQVFSMASGAMAPIAMILTGYVLGRTKITDALKDKKSYGACVLRLIVIPLAIVAALMLMRLDKQVIMLAGMVSALPFGTNSVIFLEVYGGDSGLAARLSFLSNLLSVLTIPVVYALLLKLFGA